MGEKDSSFTALWLGIIHFLGVQMVTTTGFNLTLSTQGVGFLM